ncbi:hypothetical protein KTQ83_08305 [Holdemanella porci]|mgnify:FL=1|uniref:hypothetical protein n=2 Tax=Holdemanella porci TaxID=2652276 RepID=UPI001C2BCD65|nr:hypothetical protein [Holdemanella porci]MBU9130639.1 hypothetical protein [Holdemanella porci]MBU9872571.1 hypothetical protein [Holdemanella porci]MBU9887516.1 hypothetical protein [Holdemanella porci]
MMQGSTSQINVEIEFVKEKMLESCLNVNFGILCNPLASTLYRMILDSSKTKKHIEDVSKQCKENDFYISVFIPIYLRHFYASICEECIKGYSSYDFMKLVNSLIEEDKFSEACSLCPIYEGIYIHANKKGLLTKELIQVMHLYGVDVPVTKKETKLPNIPTKAERKMSKKLDIETRKKIVGDGVKKILDMSDDELIRKYDGKSEDEIKTMLKNDPCFDSSLMDESMFEFLSLLTCFSIEFEDAFIDWLAGFILRRLYDIHLRFSVNIPPKVQTTKKQSDYSNQERVLPEADPSENYQEKKVIQPNNESKGRGGIIFLIILGLLFGYGYISLKKEEAEWETQMEQYRLENRRRTELSEFKAREEKRKKKEGQRSNSSSSSSSSSYDEGSDDAYFGDYDENRYDNDENYRDGVDDMLDELGE